MHIVSGKGIVVSPKKMVQLRVDWQLYPFCILEVYWFWLVTKNGLFSLIVSPFKASTQKKDKFSWLDPFEKSFQ